MAAKQTSAPAREPQRFVVTGLGNTNLGTGAEPIQARTVVLTPVVPEGELNKSPWRQIELLSEPGAEIGLEQGQELVMDFLAG